MNPDVDGRKMRLMPLRSDADGRKGYVWNPHPQRGGGFVGKYFSGTPANYRGMSAYGWQLWYEQLLVRGMTRSYTVVLWCADTSRFASVVGWHLLREGILAANRGRIDDDIPLVVGVANARRWPVYSREVTARGLICARSPRVTTQERYDFLVTFASMTDVDAANAPSPELPVIAATDLVRVLESVVPSELPKAEVLRLFEAVARRPTASPKSRKNSSSAREIADVCQQLVSALAR